MSKSEYNCSIGIADKDRKEIVKGLSTLLADTYTLYLKTQNYHWNVTGPMFNSLHAMFEGQYTELAGAVDEIAERIRSLGEHTPGSYSEFGKLTNIKEAEGHPDAQDMVKQLLKGHETVVCTARNIFEVAEKANDQATCDMLTSRMDIHEKTAWMLRAVAS